MYTIKTQSNTIKLFDDISEVSIERFNKYNRAVLIDSEIGSTIQDYDTHLSKLYNFIASNKKDDALAEINNMRQQIFFIQNGINPGQHCFASMIHSVDGVKVELENDSDVVDVLKVLSDGGLTESHIKEFLEGVKKKLTTN